jgi:hypothetical protein
MRRLYHYLLSLLLFYFLPSDGYSQLDQSSYTDSLKHALDTARYVPHKVQLLLDIAYCTMDRAKASDYATQAIEMAQLSRDQRMIANAYLQNGNRYMGNSALADNIVQGMKNYEQADRIARAYGLEDLQVEAYCGIASVWHYRGHDVTALSFCSAPISPMICSRSGICF